MSFSKSVRQQPATPVSGSFVSRFLRALRLTPERPAVEGRCVMALPSGRAGATGGGHRRPTLVTECDIDDAPFVASRPR
jgi:hypothetical protein